MKQRSEFNKYTYYTRAVQDTDQAIQFVERAYRSNFQKPIRTLGEDFCGTFALSSHWVKKGRGRKAVAIDYSQEPLSYGKNNYLAKLRKEQKEKITVLQRDVRDKSLPKVDALVAFNFSFFILKERSQMLSYLKNCYRRIGPKGLLVLDCFGGTSTLEPNEEKTKIRNFTYYWDQKSFDPISHNANFAIHFKRKGEKKRLNVFRYDWRMWTLPELKELLTEAGFKKVSFYFEGTTKMGNGNGVFTKKKREENCEAWIAYITARR